MGKPTRGGGCPLTRAEFREHAKPLPISVDGKALLAEVKEFGTGSLGWSLCDKLTLPVAGKPVRVQANLSLTLIGSKVLADTAEDRHAGGGESPAPGAPAGPACQPGGGKPAANEKEG